MSKIDRTRCALCRGKREDSIHNSVLSGSHEFVEWTFLQVAQQRRGYGLVIFLLGVAAAFMLLRWIG